MSKTQIPLSQRESLTVREWCALHGVSPPTLYRAWARGEGPEFFRVGRYRRIPAGARPKSPDAA